MSNCNNKTVAQNQVLSATEHQAYQAELNACAVSRMPSAMLFGLRQQVAVHRKYKQHAAALSTAEEAVCQANGFVQDGKDAVRTAPPGRVRQEAAEHLDWEEGRLNVVVALLQECRKEAGVEEAVAVAA